MINFLFFPANPSSCWTWVSFLLVHHHGSKMLRSESNSSITQSPIGWHISQFLSSLHEPTSGMCVCTYKCVFVLVSVCPAVAVCVCECSSWMAPSWTSTTHNGQVNQPAGFSCMQLCVWIASAAVTHLCVKLASFLLSSACKEQFSAHFFFKFEKKRIWVVVRKHKWSI